MVQSLNGAGKCPEPTCAVKDADTLQVLLNEVMMSLTTVSVQPQPGGYPNVGPVTPPAGGRTFLGSEKRNWPAGWIFTHKKKGAKATRKKIQGLNCGNPKINPRIPLPSLI